MASLRGHLERGGVTAAAQYLPFCLAVFHSTHQRHIARRRVLLHHQPPQRWTMATAAAAVRLRHGRLLGEGPAEHEVILSRLDACFGASVARRQIMARTRGALRFLQNGDSIDTDRR
ncbi:uncharacterized protein BDZ99DRAFT_513219 [Mytilinidion resinicola]|uniref:Uncharacterized protein n=1 Tax=Mytilinidion resinicola TaxID=574789 RepID=A0A6A6Z894_9PEZI|nr:uncharacterized protein BDZ99DRAFT_513219 [Mytilinidion resinicola]KAF2816953.1 hypothetical protein BDZ99DRAFT_513219 [Mytilinidion resinicola]